jgi:outer membrane protein TolC
MRWLLALFLAAAPSASAQTLTLERAIDLALAGNSDLAAAAAGEAEARDRRTAAGAAWFPRLDVHEGWQRGNQPVFVFGSLLGQRRFTEANFAVAALNHPDALDNFRTAVAISQPVFDGGRTLAATRTADAAASLASVSRREAAGDVAVAVAQTYARVLTTEAAVRATMAAIEAASEDAARARARRDVGLATDADVLSFDVHLAQMRARHITTSSDAQVARATLNRLIGAPLDQRWELLEPAPVAAGGPGSLDMAAAEATALRERPDLARAALRVDQAQAQALAARAALMPRIGFEGGYEWNGGTWGGRTSSWTVGVQAQLSLNTRGAEAAAASAARRAVARARADQTSAESAARLDLRTASARLEAARARQDVARTAVAQAREGERIIRDRYGSGLATVTDVLRAANAVLEAEALDITARLDVRVAAAMLDRARGRAPAAKP